MGIEVKGVLVIAIAVVFGMLMQSGPRDVSVGADESVRVPVRAWQDAAYEPVSLITPVNEPAAEMLLLEGDACVDGSCDVSGSAAESVVVAGPVRQVSGKVLQRVRERPILRALRSRLLGGRCR